MRGTGLVLGIVAALTLQACHSDQPGDSTGTLPGSLPESVAITEASDPAAIAALKRGLVAAIKTEEACGSICQSPIDVVLQWKSINDLVTSLPQTVLGDAGRSSRDAFDALYSCYQDRPFASLSQCDSEYRKWKSTLSAVLAAAQ